MDVSVSYSPIRDAEGNNVGAAVITRDITEKRLAETREHAPNASGCSWSPTQFRP